MTKNMEPHLEEIRYNDLHFEEIVGRGSFGVVYRAKWKGQTIAVKRAETETEIQSFRIEVRQLQRVSHPNIITIFGVCSDDTTNPLCLIMEYAESGSLHQLLHGVENYPQYSCAHAISWLLQCARGVAYLHGLKPKPLIHRDLKPPNILLTDSARQCKICDFGTACEARTYLTNNRGSAAWMAPEVFESNRYTEKCDVFSFGIIIWEVLTRRRPYDEIGGNIYRIMWAIHRGVRPSLIRGCPVVLEKLMTRCWAKDPTERPKMVHAVKVLAQVMKFVKGAEHPIRVKRAPQTLSRLRSIEECDSNNSLDKGPLHDRLSENVKTTVLPRDPNDPGYHTICTNTFYMPPTVEAEPEPSVRYTTLHEQHVPVKAYDDEEDDDSNYSRFSRHVVEIEGHNSNSDDHGFVENNNLGTRFPGSATRPVTLFGPGHGGSGFRVSFPLNSSPNIQIGLRSNPAVHRVQSLTVETTGNVPTTIVQRHSYRRISSTPDEVFNTDDATDDDDTSHSDSFSHKLYTVR